MDTEQTPPPPGDWDFFPADIKELIFDLLFAQRGTMLLYCDMTCIPAPNRFKTSRPLIDEDRPRVAPVFNDRLNQSKQENNLALRFMLELQTVSKAFRMAGQKRIYGRNTFRFEGRFTWWSLYFLFKSIRFARSQSAELIRCVEMMPSYDDEELELLEIPSDEEDGGFDGQEESVTQAQLDCFHYYVSLAIPRLAQTTTIAFGFPYPDGFDGGPPFSGLEGMPEMLRELIRSEHRLDPGKVRIVRDFESMKDTLDLWN